MWPATGRAGVLAVPIGVARQSFVLQGQVGQTARDAGLVIEEVTAQMR